MKYDEDYRSKSRDNGNNLIKNLKDRFDFEIFEISNAYSMILKYCDKGDEQCSEIVAYYSNIIKFFKSV